MQGGGATIAKSSRDLTTFQMPFGALRLVDLPIGFQSISKGESHSVLNVSPQLCELVNFLAAAWNRSAGSKLMLLGEMSKFGSGAFTCACESSGMAFFFVLELLWLVPLPGAMVNFVNL